MNPFLTGLAASVSRKLARHQGRPPRDARRLPLWRLLVDEVVYLAEQAVRPPWRWVWASAAVAIVAVMVGLAESTPGPVVSPGWRVAVAAVAASAVALLVRRWSGRDSG